MSIRVMSLVWDNFNRGGSDKLVMLALADWCNDQGGSLHPSMATIARKVNLTEKQARVIVHRLIDEGWITVVGNVYGGNPGQSRQYLVNLKKLSTPPVEVTPPVVVTPPASVTPPLEVTPPVEVRDPSRGGSFTPPVDGSLSTIEPPKNHQDTLSALPAKRDVANRLNGKKIMVGEVMAYLNLQASRNYRTENPNGTPTAGADVIAQRLREGYTVDQCKDVIGIKSNEWMGDEKMHKHLNPETLFRKKNFTRYLAEAEAQQ